MAAYMIELTHTPDMCLETLDRMAEKESGILDRTWWGCMDENHTGWAIVQADSKEQVVQRVRAANLEEVEITEVSRLTVKDIRKLHEKLAAYRISWPPVTLMAWPVI